MKKNILGSKVITDTDFNMPLSPLMISGYWKFFSNGKIETFLGGGLGICHIEETGSASADSLPSSASANITGLEFHTSGGFRAAPFYMDLTFSSVTASGLNANLGEEIINGGALLKYKY